MRTHARDLVETGLGWAALFVVGAGLSGCSLVPWGAQAEKAAVTVIDAAEKDRKAYNDQKADVLLTLPCDISIGAYYRIDNPVRQKAVQELCSGRELGQPTPELGSGPAAPAPAQLPTQLPTQATP